MERKKKVEKILNIVLIAASVFASIKMIFVGFNQDEEYQIVMAYRNISGDRLFAEMWEPHQMSAFLTTLLMWPFYLITGSYTGVVIYLRICGTAIQFILSAYLYRIISKKMDRETAFLISVVFFNLSPKMFASPEFSNMQFWSVCLFSKFLYEAFERGVRSAKGTVFLVLSAAALCFGVLAYPSMILEALAVIVCVMLLSPKGEKRYPTLVLLVTCFALGMAYCVFNIVNVGFDTFVDTVKQIPSSDLTHNLTETTMGTSKLLSNVTDIAKYAGMTVIIFLLAYLGVRILFKKKENNSAIRFVSVSSCISLLVPVIFWVRGAGYEEGLVNILVAFAGFIFLLKEYKGDKNIYVISFVASVMTVIAVLLMTDMTFFSTIGHGVSAVTLFLILLAKTSEEKDKNLLRIVLLLWCAFAIFSRGFMLRGGRGDSNILSVENVCRKGPAKGVFTDYMRAYIMDSDYEDWEAYVEEGESVLIVTNTLFSNITTSYLFNGSNVSHYSVVNPAAYDETLLEYWERYPDKYPDVIVVDCWYGELLFPQDSWIMQFIENDFGYSEEYDGKYLRYYRH